MTFTERILIVLLCTLITLIFFFQKRLFETRLNELNELIAYIKLLEKKIKKYENLLDLVGSALCNPAAVTLFRKLSSIDVEEFPQTREEMAKAVEIFSNETYTIQREMLVDLLKTVDDPNERKKIEFKIAKFDELKNLTSLIDPTSSREYREQISEEIHRVLQEFNDDVGTDDET
jgi:hypothetical protein